MAGDDWIKMRTDLYRDPKVCMIASELLREDGKLASYVSQHCQCDMAVTRNVTRNVTVGALVTLWGVTRHRGKRNGDDLVLSNSDLDVIDDITDLPGFGDALSVVGWVLQSGKDLIFPRFFEEYNVPPNDDAKQKNAERQRRFREKSNALRNVTVTSQSNVREEKRREEKSNTETQDADASSVARRTAKSHRPSIQEVIAYVIQIGASVDAREFVDYYESNGWKVGRNAMKDWQATVRQRESRRRKEGNGTHRPTTTQQRENNTADSLAIFERAAAARDAGLIAGIDHGGHVQPGVKAIGLQ